MQFTIEARQLTSEYTHRPAFETSLHQTKVEAYDEGEAISSFVQSSDSELVSFHTLRGRESIATVKKNDSVFLVRVYVE